jgi:hypothetical protein
MPMLFLSGGRLSRTLALWSEMQVHGLPAGPTKRSSHDPHRSSGHEDAR